MNASRLRFRGEGVTIGVAIERNPDPPHNTHLGVAYRVDGELRHLHFAFHRLLCDGQAQEGLVIAVPNLPPERQRFYTRLCLRIAERRQAIPYNFRHPQSGQFVFETGEWTGGCGLNCSYFVVYLFSSYGFQIVNPDEWPLRAADAAWHREVIDRWMRTRDPPHAARLEEEVGSQRVRPEEAAGACLYDVLPASFLQAELASRWVLQMITLDSADCYCL